MSKYGSKQKNNINGGQYYWELQDWVNKLFIEYDKCIICGTKTNLEPHHVIQVKPHDRFYSSIKNGVVMCKSCHRKYHAEYINDISPYTLVKFMENNTKTKKALNNKSLRRKLKKSNKKIKSLKEENIRLKQELNKLGVENRGLDIYDL